MGQQAQPTQSGSSTAHMLLTHLLTTPDLCDHLQRLHRLALYESGDAILGREEKDALQSVDELSARLRLMTAADYDYLRSLLAA